MSSRNIPSGMVAGGLSPNKYDKMLSKTVGNITHFSYFIKNNNPSLPDSFVLRVEQEVDGSDNLIRVEAFTNDGALTFP